MGNEAQQSRTTLQDWEAWLAPQVRVVELPEEIPVTAVGHNSQEQITYD